MYEYHVEQQNFSHELGALLQQKQEYAVTNTVRINTSIA